MTLAKSSTLLSWWTWWKCEAVRAKTILTLYNDPEVWELLGWEGASYSKGGYVSRGFADLDWLPDPRIEEAS